ALVCLGAPSLPMPAWRQPGASLASARSLANTARFVRSGLPAGCEVGAEGTAPTSPSCASEAGKLALFTRGGGAVAEVVAQVGLQEPGVAPGLESDHPAGQQARRAAGLELRIQADQAGAFTVRDDRPGVSREGDECGHAARLVGERSPRRVIGD